MVSKKVGMSIFRSCRVFKLKHPFIHKGEGEKNICILFLQLGSNFMFYYS